MSRLLTAWLTWAVMHSGGVQAESLGRLFFTAERRAALERQRQSDGTTPAPLAEGEPIRLDGLLTRSGGKATVWINGRMQHDGAPDIGIRARTTAGRPHRARLAGGEGPAVDLNVGENFDPATRTQTDVVAPGAIRAHAGR